MASRQLDEERIFHVAREISNPSTRAEYLDQICAGDQSLRERVEALLRAHEQEAEFLKSGQPELARTVQSTPLTERPGATIGRYRLMEQIGEGGMGTVFVAEQERPIRRKVAIKVIKPGMDSKAVVARFEAERQALAMMDHPNIAKVLDAGATDSGRPYFAMELVRGVPITEYCDRNRLTIRERLALFVQVCHAIQHAHQKGIIHRDIKPSNVLVTLHDGTPVPKVIDFGVAKALNTRLTDRTLYTEHMQVIGTLLYMSPEQAELSGLDVDTRSDVYSLGVVLYELLTGTTPFRKEDLDRAALDEQRRLIRDQEPPRASVRISSLGATATIVAQSRKTDPKRLNQLVRGDLDWIVTKALEKDRTRRYKTADAFAQDVGCFLTDEPIEARPPSRTYRVRRFLRRNRTAVAVCSAIGGLIVASTVIAFAGWRSAWRTSHEAQLTAERANKLLEEKQLTLLKLADASYGEAVTCALAGNEQKAEAALAIAQDAGISPVKINIIKALMDINSGRNDQAILAAEECLAGLEQGDVSDRIAVHALLVTACCYAGYDDRSFQELAVLRTLPPEQDIDYLFKTYAELVNNPQAALDLIERVPVIKRSSVGLFLRSIARIIVASGSEDAGVLDDALRDSEYVTLLFGENQCSLAYRVLALTNALTAARRNGRDEDVQKYEALGRQEAKKLMQYEGFPGSHFDLWLFHLAVGEEELASQIIRRVGRHPGTYSFFLAADCFRRFDGEHAVREFAEAVSPEVRGSKYVRLAEAHLVRELDGGEQLVDKLVKDCLDDRSPLIRRYALLAQCLIRSDIEIEALAARGLLQDSPAHDATVEGWGDRPCVRYLAGEINEEELWSQTGQRGFSGAVAHFTMGMKNLAKGNRDEAERRFRECVAMNRIGVFDTAWAQAYLRRMEDPAWPLWLRNDSTTQSVRMR